MDEILGLGKALSDPARVRILNALLKSELCVCELGDALSLSQSTLSTHLQTLRNGGIVRTEKRRTWIIYSVSPDVLSALQSIFERFPLTGALIERDNERLEHRIRLRVDGCCVVGNRERDASAREVTA